MQYKDLEKYTFNLPEELIARYPSDKRGEDRLLVVNVKEHFLEEKRFSEINNYFSKGDILIRNNTKVIPKRIYLKRKSGALVEALFLKYRKEEKDWEVLINRQKRLKQEERLCIYLPLKETVYEEFCFAYRKIKNKTYLKALFQNSKMDEHFWNTYGQMPIPPYLKREAEDLDKDRYQTVFASKGFSSAAPTAGLHFTENHLKILQKKGVTLLDLQLEIGLGTFAPLYENNFINKKLHKESYYISDDFAAAYNQASNSDKGIFILGTTSLRALESSLQQSDGNNKTGLLKKTGWQDTDIFIYPPYKFKSGSALITNFHLPASSLFLLVSAFAGAEIMLEAYHYAIEKKFHFYSYGDSMLILN